MQQSFDFFSQYEIPSIILCNPNQEELYSLGLAYNMKITKRFNGLWEFSFVFPESIDGGQNTLEPYAYLKNKRLIKVENYGTFQIIKAEEDLDGSVSTMNVECTSLESELIQKKLISYGPLTSKLWDIFDPTGTILYDLISLAPNWSVGSISSSLLVKFRSFEISDSNIYQFLTVDVANAFECVFVFNTDTRTINVYDTSDATTETDVFLSFDNVISSAKFSEKSDEITTALRVSGGGDLGINLVNPLGTNYIYDFSYYASTAWMSSGLVSAITAWEALITSLQADYANGLTLLSTYHGELLVLQAALAVLNSDLLTLEGVKGAKIQLQESLVTINAQILAKQAEITSQNSLITNKQTQISDITLDLQTINTQVSFDTNFTAPQLLELNSFIFENSYLNENIIQTDSMTQVEIQAQAQALYDQAQNVLSRVSQPRYEFELESVNYIVLPEFQIFTQQTDVGAIVTCELKDGTYIESVLLEIESQFDDPSNFSMVFSNRLRLDNENFTYSDLMGKVQSVGGSVAFDSYKWANWESDYKDSVSTFITSALDATVNNLISNTNQEILINQNGLMGRSWDSALGAYKPKQVWLTNNVLAFSDDGFSTAKLALGEITLSGGGTSYGLVGEVIIGHILAGNTLTISNSGNNFVLDQTGATLTNAKFSIETTNTKILLDPTQSRTFRIQKNEGGTFNDKFWVDNAGNVNFSGNLSGASGTFSGALSGATGTFSGALSGATGTFSGALVAATGTFSGNLSGASGTFSGDIYANRLIGAVSYSQLTDIPAEKITSGTMSGSRIYGGTMTVAGMASVGGTLDVTGSIQVHSNIIGLGNLLIYGGGIAINGTYGKTVGYSVSTPYGTRVLYFNAGILTSYT